MTDTEYRELFNRSPQLAQNILFDEYFAYVYTIVFSKLRSCAPKEDIEECVSDVFADIFAYFDRSSDREGNIKGIIGTVASRRAINMYHSISSKSGRTVSMEEGAADYITDSADLTRNAERGELRTTLLRLIDELGEPDSVMILQKYYYGMNSREIAETNGSKPSAVRVRLSRAMKKLKEKLEALDISLKE